MISALFAILFGLSLLPGRKPLCLAFAERISGGIMPDGAAGYCRRLTWVWLFVLSACAAASLGLAVMCGRDGLLASPFISIAAVSSMFLAEGAVRRRRFSVAFRTSGSTSVPKTIVKTFESLAREVAFHRDRLSIPPGTLFLSTIEPDHMYGTLWRVMLPVAAGCDVDPEIIRAPEALLEKMRAAGRVFFVTTPSFLKRFCAYADQYEVPQNCIEVTTSGSLLDAETSAATRRVFGIAPLEIFGSTETGGVAWRRQGGSVADGYDWSVFDPVRVSLSKDGRLTVRSPFSFCRRYVMGDGAELSGDGRRFKLLGRMDRIVKIAEKRISLPELEARASGLEGVGEVALVALDDGKGAYLGAVAETLDGSLKSHDPQSILKARRMFASVFPSGTIPRKYRFVRSLPRNAQGKILQSALRDLLADR